MNYTIDHSTMVDLEYPNQAMIIETDCELNARQLLQVVMWGLCLKNTLDIGRAILLSHFHLADTPSLITSAEA